MNKIDLHNDLLNYLAKDSSRTAYDEQLECSIPKMIAGGITIQILAAFSLTPNNASALSIQFKEFNNLKQSPEYLDGEICFLWAIEDAQQLIAPSELGAKPEDKLRFLCSSGNRPVYVSLTWIYENDLGGGDRTNIGLKPKGESLLDALAVENISIDLSHASDALAYDILNYHERKGHQNGVLISHTNFRGRYDSPRNVSDEMAMRILDCGGIIGLSFSKNQLGDAESLDLKQHYNYALSLDSRFAGALCLGGDLYHEEDVPRAYRKSDSNFYSSLCSSAHYSSLDQLSSALLFDNAYAYLKKHGLL